MSNSITVITFAQVRESVAESEFSVPVPAEGVTLAQIKTQLKERSDGWKLALQSGVLSARNETLCDDSTQVNPGDRIAFFPPVTGG